MFPQPGDWTGSQKIWTELPRLSQRSHVSLESLLDPGPVTCLAHPGDFSLWQDLNHMGHPKSTEILPVNSSHFLFPQKRQQRCSFFYIYIYTHMYVFLLRTGLCCPPRMTLDTFSVISQYHPVRFNSSLIQIPQSCCCILVYLFCQTYSSDIFVYAKFLEVSSLEHYTS